MVTLRQKLRLLLNFVFSLVLVLTPLLVSAANPVLDMADTAAQTIVFSVLTAITGMFLAFGGFLLDTGVNSFVIGFGDMFLWTGVGVAVDSVWVIIRDFMNLFFIFGLVYIGFKMILGTDNSNTRRWLVNLIIAALLINFSLFFTKLVVDVSNQLAAEIAVGAFDGKSETDPQTNISSYKVDMSSQLMVRMGITSVWSTYKGTSGTPPTGGWGYIFGAAILFMISAFVFAAGGILLIIRFALLNLFMVLSPIMFIGWILPPVSDVMGRYWKAFLGRAFFAPIYLLFIYFSLTILDGLQQAGLGKPNWAAAFGAAAPSEQAASLSSTLPFFLLICIFMIASLVIAQKLGADGADKAMSLGKSWGNKATRFTASQTAGRGARAASNWAGSTAESGLRRAQQMQGTGFGARATRYIARSNAVGGNVASAATTMQGAKFGMSRTVEEDKKMRAKTEKNSNDAMAVTTGLEAQRKLEAIKSGKIKTNNRGVEIEEDIATMTDERKAELGLTELTSTDVATQEAAQKKAEEESEKMQRLAANMSVKDFEAMSEDQQEQIAEFLSGTQTDAVMKSENISDEQKGKIENAQKAAIEKIIDSNGEYLTEKITNLSIRQIETMGDDFINKHAAHFTDSQISEIKKSKKFTESQVGRFAGKRKTDLLTMVNNPATAAQAFEQTTGRDANGVMQTKARKTAEIAKLPGDVLADGNSVKFLTVDVLKAITNNDKGFEQVSMEQREKIYNQLQLQALTPGALNPNAIKALNYIRSIKGQEEFLGR